MAKHKFGPVVAAIWGPARLLYKFQKNPKDVHAADFPLEFSSQNISALTSFRKEIRKLERELTRP